MTGVLLSTFFFILCIIGIIRPRSVGIFSTFFLALLSEPILSNDTIFVDNFCWSHRTDTNEQVKKTL